MIPYKDWYKTTYKKFSRRSQRDQSYVLFFRESPRAQRVFHGHILAPADGTVISVADNVAGTDTFPYKGADFTLNDVMDATLEPDVRCIVICTFLSFADGHVLRHPMTGRLSELEYLPPRKLNNDSMLETEELLFSGKPHLPDVQAASARYMKNNERVIAETYSPLLDQEIYTVIVADADVAITAYLGAVSDTDLPFPNTPVAAGERSFLCRWGSHATLIIPREHHMKYKVLAKPLHHVMAGTDTMVKLRPKQPLVLPTPSGDETDPLDTGTGEYLPAEDVSHEDGRLS